MREVLEVIWGSGNGNIFAKATRQPFQQKARRANHQTARKVELMAYVSIINGKLCGLFSDPQPGIEGFVEIAG